jgi:hypothetical protein
VIEYTLRFSKPVTVSGDWNHGDPELRAAQRQAIKAQHQAIRRKLKRNPTPETRTKLEAEKARLSDLETLVFGVRHRAGAVLPAPSVEDIVEEATFRRFADRGRIVTALARLAVTNPAKYGDVVHEEAQKDPRIRRALNRARSDARPKQLKQAERLVLENFYASAILKRPLRGLAACDAAIMLVEATHIPMNADKYRRIVKKFYLE